MADEGLSIAPTTAVSTSGLDLARIASGRVVEARVASLADGLAIVTTRHGTLQIDLAAFGRTAPAVGDAVRLQVQAIDGGGRATATVVEVRPGGEGAAVPVVSSGVEEAARVLARAVQDAAAKQNGLAPLYAALSGLQSAPAGSVPEAVRSLVAQLMGARLGDASAPTGDAVKKAFLGSGVFLEARLTTAPSAAAVPREDLKAALFSLRAALANWVGETGAKGAPVSGTGGAPVGAKSAGDATVGDAAGAARAVPGRSSAGPYGGAAVPGGYGRGVSPSAQALPAGAGTAGAVGRSDGGTGVSGAPLGGGPGQSGAAPSASVGLSSANAYGMRPASSASASVSASAVGSPATTGSAPAVPSGAVPREMPGTVPAGASSVAGGVGPAAATLPSGVAVPAADTAAPAVVTTRVGSPSGALETAVPVAPAMAPNTGAVTTPGAGGAATASPSGGSGMGSVTVTGEPIAADAMAGVATPASATAGSGVAPGGPQTAPALPARDPLAIPESDPAPATAVAAGGATVAAQSAPAAGEDGLSVLLSAVVRGLEIVGSLTALRASEMSEAAAALAAIGTDREAKPPPPRRGQAPRGQAAQASERVGADGVEGLGRRALERTEGALSRILLEQFAALDRRDEAPATAGADARTTREWTVEMPIATRSGTGVVQMTVERDGGRSRSGAAPTSTGWRVRFSMDVEPLGPIHAQIGLAGEKLAIGLWAERPDAAARLGDDVGRLQGALEAAEIPVESIRLATGRPSSGASVPSAGRFVDVKL